MKRKVIVVTDGDKIAKCAVEIAAANIGARCISATAGNPTGISGYDIVRLIKMAKYDPVVIMIDDRGNIGVGEGEKALHYIIKDDDIEVIGIVAVASNSPKSRGVMVDYSVDRFGRLFDKAVDKHGIIKNNKLLRGDTVNSLPELDVPLIIGIGDPGKMGGYDMKEFGSPILTKAMKKILDNYNEISKKRS